MLYEKNEKSIVYRKKRYAVDFSFNSILDCMEIMDDGKLADVDKMDLMAWRLFRHRVSNRKITPLLQAVFAAIRPEKKASGKKVLDLEQDKEYIKAGFRQAYKVDLQKEFGRLHWKDFLGMLEALPSDTKMAEIVSIRTQPVPKSTKYNHEQVAALLRAKRAVALKEPKKSDVGKQFSGMFDMLKQNAKGR